MHIIVEAINNVYNIITRKASYSLTVTRYSLTHSLYILSRSYRSDDDGQTLSRVCDFTCFSGLEVIIKR